MTKNITGALKKNPDIISRVIEDEVVLLPVYRTSDDINCIYTLNESASFIWDAIDNEHTLEQIEKMVVEGFDTTQKEASQKISGIIKELYEIKALV